MQVIGAGFGRTGTKSLQKALESLGYGKCYHMTELFTHPEHVHYWRKAHNKEKVAWSELFQGYQSIVDFPGSLYLDQLASAYPDAKIVLTIRDPDKWYQSVKKTIYSFDPGVMVKLKVLLKFPFSAKARNFLKVLKFNDDSIWNGIFLGDFENEERMKQIFLSHIEEVKEKYKDRLLVFNAGDGWESLCNFLDKPVPSEPYPHSNKGEDFHSWIKVFIKENVL